MTLKTETIKFNLNDRKRSHRGVDRNFDAVATASYINSPAVQERVKMRDLIGFFGHWAREKFGINPPEGAIVDGKQVCLEPAFITTRLVAHNDGTIEHEAEFADTAPGRVAQRLYKSNLGGFSTAFATRTLGDLLVPQEFGGFDYVYEPNYTENRGYKVVFDGVKTPLTLDDVGQCLVTMDRLNSMLDQLQADYERQAKAMAAVCLENEACLSLLVKKGISRPDMTLDSVRPDFVKKQCVFDSAKRFLSAELSEYETANQDTEVKPQQSGVIKRWFGV